MKNDKAIKILARHLMQCGALMPIDWVQKNGEGSEFMQAYDMAMDALKKEPVRCKDCTYWERRLVNAKGFAICAASGMDITADDFCSYGEKMDGGNEDV